jgi:hypothetical protein
VLADIKSPRTSGAFFSLPFQFALNTYLFHNLKTLFFWHTALYDAVSKMILGVGMETNNEVLSRKETAAFLGVCLTTLDRLDIPKTRVRHRVMYRREALNKWIEKHTDKPKRGEA